MYANVLLEWVVCHWVLAILDLLSSDSACVFIGET